MLIHTPVFPANAISKMQLKNPPSPQSCPARIFIPPLISSCILSKIRLILSIIEYGPASGCDIFWIKIIVLCLYAGLRSGVVLKYIFETGAYPVNTREPGDLISVLLCFATIDRLSLPPSIAIPS